MRLSCWALYCLLAACASFPTPQTLPDALEDIIDPSDAIEELSDEIADVIEEKSADIKKCMVGFAENNHDCYTSLDEVALDLGYFGKPFDVIRQETEDAGATLPLNEVTSPTKPLPLLALENAVKDPSSILANTPIGYLAKYGYMRGVISATCNQDQLITKSDIFDASMTFMEATGTNASEAGKAMMLKRCGMPDIQFDNHGNLEDSSLNLIANAIGEDKVESHRRKKRWVHHRNGRGDIGNKGKTEYTYKLHSYTLPDQTKFQYNFAMKDVNDAFGMWQKAMKNSLNFSRAEEGKDADFNLSFEPVSHGDGNDFEKNEFAHAAYPLMKNHGQVHYKNTETWNYDKDDVNALNFRWITTHEIGHVLGLDHTYAQAVDGVPPIMTATYQRVSEAFRSREVKLSDDDISAIRVLYGDISVNTRCQKGWTGFEKMCYKLEHRTNAVSWTTALSQCKSLEATLVTVSNEIIHSFLPSKVANGRTPFWIGRKSNLDTWTSGDKIGKYKPVGSSMKFNKKKPKCAIVSAANGITVWKYVDCKEKSKIENFVCEKEEESSTPAPPTEPSTTEGPAGQVATEESPYDVPCQNYIKGAVRRKNYLYIFGNTLYFKYYYPQLSRPKIVNGYPKRIEDSFPEIPSTFTAVVNSPYDPTLLMFFDRDMVYDYKLDGKNVNLEFGKLIRKPKKIRKKFKTSNYMRGATKFDKDSIFLFAANGEVGKWNRKKKKTKYEKIEKWDYFDTNKIKVDAVAPSCYDNYLQFFTKEEYFLMRKSDGRIPEKFKRPTSLDFEKLNFCDILAPLVMRNDEDYSYPADIDPDTAVTLEDNVAF